MQVEPGTCLQKLIGSVRTGVILKDVSLEVHGGELHAVLGSKGSGKRALLEVISRRAQGPTRGNIALNGVPMSMRLFQVLKYIIIRIRTIFNDLWLGVDWEFVRSFVSLTTVKKKIYF